MEINRSNYEIWIIDMLDGKLDKDQVRMVELFLKQNPDLAKETENLSDLQLVPSKLKFKGKSLLRKSASEITDSQFENLCVAHLENDLSDNQEAELIDIITTTPGKKKVFDTIQKTKLRPADIVYPNKNQLYKKTLAGKVVRLSAVVLSAAAILTFALIIFKTNYSPVTVTPALEAVYLKPASQPPAANVKTQTINSYTTVPVKSDNIKTQIISVPANETKQVIDSSSQNKKTVTIRFPEPEKLYMQADIKLATAESQKSLVPSTIKKTKPHAEEEEEYHNRIGRFIAKNFREKILKEQNTTDTPLKGYEIAEAGVSGLNKLLGWEMALSNINDENGELKSVYFSSKILKFNTPVKK